MRAVDVDDPYEGALAAVERAAVVRALKTLPARQREASCTLWRTLEPVSSPTPELTRLRRLARRRRRRLQGTAAALGLLLIAGAGFGIAEATNGNSGRATVTANSPPPAPTVSVSCAAASRDSHSIVVSRGQTLVLTDCPTGATATASGAGALEPAGDLTFRAVMLGTDGVTLTYKSCADVAASIRADCDGGAIVIGFDVKVIAGSAPTSSAVAAPCKSGRVTVPVGEQLHLTDCPVGLSSHVDDLTVLAAGAKPDAFTAKKAGTTNVDLFVKPQCSPGMLCPKYVRDLGTLVVTVTPAG